MASVGSACPREGDRLENRLGKLLVLTGSATAVARATVRRAVQVEALAQNEFERTYKALAT